MFYKKASILHSFSKYVFQIFGNIYIYESGEEDTNSKKLNLGLFQLEFIVSIQVNHLISLSSYNSLPKEEF